MTVRGQIVSMSHLGGALVKFDGVAPGLGWEVRIEGGRSVGRVDSVIGSVNSGMIHVTLSESIDPASATGAPVEIARSANRKGRVRGNQRGDSKSSMIRHAKNKGKRRETAGRVLPTWVCKKCRTLNSKTWKCTNCGEGRPERQRSSGDRSSDGSNRPRRLGSGRYGGGRASKRGRPMSGGSKSKHRPSPSGGRGRGKQGRKPPR